MNRQYIISEELLEQIKQFLLRLNQIEYNNTNRKIEDMLLHLNYVKEAPKTCKCE